MEEGSDGPNLTQLQQNSFPIKAHWQAVRRNKTKTKREEPEVHGCPKRAAEGNASEKFNFCCHVLSRQRCSLHCSTTLPPNYYSDVNVRITFYSYGPQTNIFLTVYHLRVLCKGMRRRSVCHIHGRCVQKSKYFHWKLMAQRETGQLLIKAQQLTSQHMLDELLKIQVTPCEEINCCSSSIRICSMSALEAKWRLFFISLNQNGSLSLQTDVPWKVEAWLYICKDKLPFTY